MGQRTSSKRRGALAAAGAVVAMTMLVIGAGCSRREDDRSIKPAPEQSAPAPTVTATTEPPAPVATEGAPNPLAMPLKHDGPVASASASAETVDPCALPEPTGPLAMKLRHDRPKVPGQRNPLCMKLK